MNYRSIADLNETILKKLYVLPRDFDLIVGVPRSGMLPANLIALYLNLPYTDIDSFIQGYVYKSGARSQFFDDTEQKKVLIVDDSLASGSALRECREKLHHLQDIYKMEFCVVYAVPEKKNLVEYPLETVATPRYFQWNIFNHSTLEKACFDIDGVLCVDPNEEQNDDGEKYRDFLLHAAPLYIPKSKIGTLVTSRLEKYRTETEQWLVNYNIKYDKLVMLDLPNQKARQQANCHGTHKAKEFKKSHYKLFVESDLGQAKEINSLTKKPVFCTANFEMIFQSQSLIYNVKSGKYFPVLRSAALKLRVVLRKIISQLRRNKLETKTN